jgi:hypothetical protein
MRASRACQAARWRGPRRWRRRHRAEARDRDASGPSTEAMASPRKGAPLWKAMTTETVGVSAADVIGKGGSARIWGRRLSDGARPGHHPAAVIPAAASAAQGFSAPQREWAGNRRPPSPLRPVPPSRRIWPGIWHAMTVPKGTHRRNGMAQRPPSCRASARAPVARPAGAHGAGGVLRGIRRARRQALVPLGRVVERAVDELRLVARAARVAGGLLTLEVRATADGLICGEVQSVGDYGYGTYEIRLRTGRGSGLNAAFFTYIGPVHDRAHHEIDIELLLRDTARPSLSTPSSKRCRSMAGRPSVCRCRATRPSISYAFTWRPDGITWFVDGGARAPHRTRRAAASAAAEDLRKPLEQRQFSRLDGALRRRRPCRRNCGSTGSPSRRSGRPASSRTPSPARRIEDDPGHGAIRTVQRAGARPAPRHARRPRSRRWRWSRSSARSRRWSSWPADWRRWRCARARRCSTSWNIRWLMVLPALCMASVLWSEAPGATLRAGHPADA